MLTASTYYTQYRELFSESPRYGLIRRAAVLAAQQVLREIDAGMIDPDAMPHATLANYALAHAETLARMHGAEPRSTGYAMTLAFEHAIETADRKRRFRETLALRTLDHIRLLGRPSFATFV